MLRGAPGVGIQPTAECAKLLRKGFFPFCHFLGLCLQSMYEHARIRALWAS